MAEVVAPPDAEAMYVAYLKAQFASRSDTARVGTKVPTNRPDRMARVSLVNMVEQTDIHFYVRLLVECWDLTESNAFGLARLAYALTRAMEGETSGGVYVAEVVTVGGPVHLDDPDVGPRYQFVTDLLVRGSVI